MKKTKKMEEIKQQLKDKNQNLKDLKILNNKAMKTKIPKMTKNKMIMLNMISNKKRKKPEPNTEMILKILFLQESSNSQALEEFWHNS